MKLLVSFFFSLSFFVLFAQDYKTPIPQVINFEGRPNFQMKLAWFSPENFKEATLFQKIEIGVQLPNHIMELVNGFLFSERRPNKINPFNRHELDVTAEIYKGDSLVKTVDAFYYEEYKRNLQQNKWDLDTTSFPFRIRLALSDIGDYTAKISVEMNGVFQEESSFGFVVEQSYYPGYLELGENKKHMRFSGNKTSFVGVGQEIPWAFWEDFSACDKMTGPVGFQDVHNALSKMGDAGGNYTRFLATPWHMLLEWEALGNYQPRMGQAWEFDRVDELCSEKSIYYIYTLLWSSVLEDRTEEEKNQLPGVRWLTYCYNDDDLTVNNLPKAELIGMTKSSEFYSNETAIDHQQNYFRYVVSRWGFSTSVAGWQLMNEIDNTAHYRESKETRNAVTKWVHQNVDYITSELNDSHLKSVSLVGGENSTSDLWDPEIFNAENIDFMNLHPYGYEDEKDGAIVRNRNVLLRYNQMNNIGVGLQKEVISYPEFQKKMFLFDENGHIVTTPRMWPQDKDVDPTVIFNDCADFMFKEDLWFTFTAGASVAGLDWWNGLENGRQDDWERYFPGLQKFIVDIDFENVNYSKVKEHNGTYYIAQRWPFTDKDIKRTNKKPYKKYDKLEAYVQLSEGGEQGFGWMKNRSFIWINLLDSLDCLNDMFSANAPYSKRYLYTPGDNDLVDEPIDINKKEAFIKVYNVQSKTKFKIVYYDTETNEILSEEVRKSSRRGTLKIFSPEIKYGDRFDVAFKFYVASSVWMK